MSQVFVFTALILALILAVACFTLWWRCRTTLTASQKHSRLQAEEKKIFFDFMHEMGEAFNEDIGQDQMLTLMLDAVCRVTSAQSGAIYLVESHPPCLRAALVRGWFPPPGPLSPEVWNQALFGQDELQDVLRKQALPLGTALGLPGLFQRGEDLLLNGEETRAFFPPSKDPIPATESVLLVTLHYRGDNLGLIALVNPAGSGTFTPEHLEIVRSIAAQSAFSLYHAAVYRQLAEKKQLDRDLEVAREIQQILLPARCPEIPGYELAAVNLPAKYVSGDYFDFIRVDEHHWGLVIADVSGKGVPASLVMAMCRSVLRMQARGCHSAAEVLRRVNRILFPDLRNDMFITVAYAILDTQKNQLTVAKAGHDAPLFRQSDNGVIRLLQSPGMVLGIDSGDVFDMVIQDLAVPLQPGDMLLMYTDGVSEAADEEGREFGRDPLQDALRHCSTSGASALTVNIVDRVSRFRGKAMQSDDITLLSLQKK